MEIVINKCFGGFNFSKDFKKAYPDFFLAGDGDRADPELIAVLKDFGLDKASGGFSKLKIVEIPGSATDWEIDNYDGMESVTYVQNGMIYHEY